MNELFLHGGGDDEAVRSITFGRFVKHCSGPGPIAIVVVGANAQDAREDGDDYVLIFASLGVAESRLRVLYPTPGQPLRREQVAEIEPSGVFICGGVTPDYHAALCIDKSWLTVPLGSGIPIGGSSAGAAIASETAILGGWQTPSQLSQRPIIYSGAGEGLDRLTVAPGLGLVPFAIDVHAGQLGTLTRLMHAVAFGHVAEGWAIDENTQLEISDGRLHIYGMGHAYHVKFDGRDVRVRIHAADNRANDL